MNRFALIRALVPLLFTVLLSACDSEGIDRFDEAASLGSGTGAVSTGPNRFVQLEKLSFEATLPSIISVMFQAKDRFDNAISGLQTNDFQILEDDLPVSVAETSLSIVPREQLPFSLRTVLMIDTSSSISPSDLDKIKAALLGLIIDVNGRSLLLPQQEIAIYSFDDTVTLLRDFSSSTEGLVSTIENIQPAIAITPTDFYGAAITGAGRIEDSFDLNQITQGAVIIITDGTDTAGRNTLEDAIDAVTGKSVYTLGVGDEISADILGRIGTRGTFNLRSFDQLNSALATINQQVVDSANSFYFLHYASPKRRAEGDASSIHNIELSVINNANNGSSSTITDSFDSSEFSNVQAEVVIAGPNRLELQQSAVYRANTRWAPQPISNYVWSLQEEGNTSCAIGNQTSTSITVTGVASGNCTLIAEDLSAGGVQAWFTIEVVLD